MVAFVFLVDPALRPDPRERQEASLAALAVDQGITFRGFTERIGAAQAPQAQSTGACVPGSVVYLRISLVGFKDRETKLRYLTFDTKTHRRVRGAVNRPGQAMELIVKGKVVRVGGLTVRSEVPSEQSVLPQWVQWPFADDSYFVRFELSRGNNLLAVVDTKPFPVDRTRYVKLFNRCRRERADHRPSEGPGFQEASLTPAGGGFDTSRWLIYVFALGAAGVIGAGIYSSVGWLRNRRTPG